LWLRLRANITDYRTCDGRPPAQPPSKLPHVEENLDLLDDEAIESRLAELEGWKREGDAITKTFERGDFVGSVEFVRKLVEPAEEMGHHPDLSISWDKVEISITSHAAGGLTEDDFELAKRIDALA
jgi:4a-hydroxytetrahydrobiopterin dehydratase